MKKTALKISIDIFMIIIWIVLMTYDLTGSVWHEILGIGMLIPLFFHLFLNWKWIINVSKNIFKTKPNVNTVRWVCDILMLIGYVLTAVSGVAISKELFWQIRADNNELWYTIHAWSAYLTLAVLGVHVGLHWKMILGFFRSAFHIQKPTRLRRTVGAVISLAVILYGIKSTVTYSLPAYTAADDATVDYTTSQLAYSEYGNEEESSVKIINIGTRPSTSNTITETPNVGETLNEFLGRLFCNGCSRHCSLLSPGCSTGRSLVTQANTIYSEFTATASSASSASASSAATSSASTESVVSSAAASSSPASSTVTSSSSPGSVVTSSASTESVVSSAAASTAASSATTPSESAETGVSQTSSDTQVWESSGTEQSASSQEQTPSTDDGEFFEYSGKVLSNLSILGMYIAGTYYVVEFLGKKH
ncbi:MAG TPA: DUF4405 domain-containing protein [Oscillospiraceae bacterium]|nr:DUF4405 domain-containing protein [Oscillospiraceae bacterium]